mgnify:CR=1 FL=1
MLLCPNCKTENEEGSVRCNNCGTLLVIDEKEESKNIEVDNSVFLTNVADEFEAGIIESKLKEAKIPVLRKYKESGSYINIYMGNTVYGIDLYVPSQLFVEAKEIIQTDNIELGEKDVENDEFELKIQRKRRFRAWFILIILIPGLLWLLMLIVLSVLDFFT